MEIEDISFNRRVASLWKLASQLRATSAPSETMRVVRQALSDAYGPIASMLLSTRDLPAGHFQIVQLNLEPIIIIEEDFLPSETVYHGGVMGQIISVREPKLIQNVDWTGDQDFEEILGPFRSVVAVPLMSARLPMSWILLLKRAPDRMTSANLEELLLRSALVGSLMESQTLVVDLAQANARIDREVRQTGDLQRLLLPTPLPQIPGLSTAVSYEPSGRAGGDLYDLFLLDRASDEPERWCMLMADASGHGLVAAVVMAIVQSIVRAHPLVIKGPGDLLAHMNLHLCQKNLGGFVTAFLMIYTPITKQFVCASAGHPHPLKKSIDTVSSLEISTSVPLGIDPEATFAQTCIELTDGETLLLYTDGITDARNLDGELFDEVRIQRALRELETDPQILIDQLRKQLDAYQSGRPATDDQTMLAIRAIG